MKNMTGGNVVIRAGLLAVAAMLPFGGSIVRAAELAPWRAMIPRPVSLAAGQVFFTLTADTVLVADAASRTTAAQLAGYLQPATGYALNIAADAGGARNVITLAQDPGLTELGTEGYLLQVSQQRIALIAPTQAGLFYAVQTLRQLLPPAIFSTNAASNIAWQVPCMIIKDAPCFGWRGLMLDTGHDFQHLPFILRFIDLMALHKFNTLHWHIVDLGTWPLEIKSYPKLIEPSNRGTRRMGNPQRGVKPGYYTQDQVRQVVRYAAERHITIVPEIEMPGHSPVALAAYPEFDCPVTQKVWEWDRWSYCAGNEKTYGFLQDVLTQVMDLFPSAFIHIGGDECPKVRWQKCPLCQARMKTEGLKNEEELQSYFVKRIEKFLNAKGRRLIGWDEILEGGLAPNAAVMAWRPAHKAELAATQAGHDVVMASTSHLYFDYSYATTPLQKVYSFEPVSKELTPAQAAHILGAQAQMWTDNHPTEQEIEALVYPRACALAEVVWSPAAARDYGSFAARLQVHARRLSALDVHYHPLAP